jgi:hypothetical protein
VLEAMAWAPRRLVAADRRADRVRAADPLANEMIPEAFEYSERTKTVGLALAFGFALSAALSFSS